MRKELLVTILELININSSWLINSRQLQMFIPYLHCLEPQYSQKSCPAGRAGSGRRFQSFPRFGKEEGKGLCKAGCNPTSADLVPPRAQTSLKLKAFFFFFFKLILLSPTHLKSTPPHSLFKNANTFGMLMVSQSFTS